LITSMLWFIIVIMYKQRDKKAKTHGDTFDKSMSMIFWLQQNRINPLQEARRRCKRETGRDSQMPQ